MLCFVFLWHLMFLMAIDEAEKCLAGCRVTKRSFDKCLLTAWVFWIVKTGGHAVLEHYILAVELRVHVSRLPMPHLDRDQWKHFILNILLLVGLM